GSGGSSLFVRRLLFLFTPTPQLLAKCHTWFLKQEIRECREWENSQECPQTVKAKCRCRMPAMQVIFYVGHEENQQRQVPHIQAEGDESNPAQGPPFKWPFERGGAKDRKSTRLNSSHLV